MLQRYERRSIEEQLITARAELNSDYELIQQLNYQQLAASDSAELLLSMLNKLSSPAIGTQIMRTDLAHLEYPYLAEYEAIMDKAEVYYYQSILQDLNRIKNNEPIIQISKEEIRQCVEELNWKINVQRSSRLNQSQEVGENMDLMKFFQGVRNYQNWHENIKRETFTRLKERSHAIQNELSFKKGFILSRLDKQMTSIQTNNLTELFKINHKYVKFQRIAHILSKIRHNKKKQAFNVILKKSKQTSIVKILSQMFIRYLPKRFVADLRKTAVQLKIRKQKITKLVNRVSYLKKKTEIVLKYGALKKLNITPMIKASKYTSALKLITHACQKYHVRSMIKYFNLPTKTIFYRLAEKYMTRIRQAFTELKQNDVEIRLERPNVSYRVKGKILASLNKYEKEPINLKQTFSKWYLNTHEQKYAKRVYNIWLQGNTNKFTFFMRLKNMVHLLSKQTISKELKNFVKVICDRYHKYEEHNKKNFLTRWIENNRRLRKIQGMFRLLTDITTETIVGFKELAIEKIIEYCKRKQIIKQYCNKYMLQHIENVKIALMKWKTINNIKKEWGRKKLRMILLKSTEQLINNKKDSLNILKKYWIQGREKKTNITRKAINKDLIFLQRFMQTWRHNIGNTKAEENIAEKQTNLNKTLSITGISNTFKRVQIYDIRNIINKFASKRLQRLRRQANLKNNFINLIQSNEKNLKKEVFDVFAENLRTGKKKKDKLVSKLVCANVVKEKLALLIFKNKAFEMTQLMKRQKSAKIFEIIQSKIKQNYLIFNKRLFVARVLQKIVNNHTQNISKAFKSWKAMPLRIRWKLRSKLINLHQRLSFLMNQRLSFCNDAFKSSLITAKLKQKKAVYIMACKYEMILKKYFGIYYRNSQIQRQDNKIIAVTKLFEAMAEREKNNLKPLFKSPPQWPKKAANFQKLNEYVKRRLQDYLHSWYKNAGALKYFNTIKDEKKKRCLQLAAKVMNNYENRKAKQIVQAFHKNSKLRQRKMHILKKMCDSQVIKILNGFNSWKNLPAVTNKLKVEKAAKFESSLTGLVTRNLKITINAMKNCMIIGQQKKIQLVRSLVSSLSGRVRSLFNKWREYKNICIVIDKQHKVQKTFNILVERTKPHFEPLIHGDQSKRKIKSLTIIDNYWNRQKKQYIKQWHRKTFNLKMKDVSKKYLLVNLINIKKKYQNKMLVEQIINKFKKNSEQKLKEKHRNRTIQLSKIIDNYESHKRLLINMTVDKLKFNHIKGNFHKNRSFHRFLTEKITQVHKMLDVWNKLAQQAKQTHKQKMAAHNFDHMHEIIKQNFFTIFGRTKESTIKKNVLDRLCKVTEAKYKGFFNLWRQNVKELKLLGQFDKQTKAAILDRINKIVQSTSNQAVVSAIKKFSLNLKVERIQRKFVQKLLQTKSGKVINAFKTWKTIPVANMMGKYKNYQKFYFKLQNFFKDRLKFAHSAFSQTSDDATLMKKQSILKLFEMTSLGIRRYYNRWTRLTKQKHILMTVNRSLKAFEVGQAAIANQYRIIFQDERAYRLKISTIDKLIAATRGTTQNYFNKWRANVREYNIANNMDKEKKKLALGIFNKVMGNSKTGQVLHVIELFQKNVKVVKVAKNFFNRLMNTKAGKVLGFFQKLKTIPDAKFNKLKKKGIIFESRLHNFVHQRLRATLNPIKQNIFTANTKKKYCIERLLRACMGQNQKKFLLWRNINRQAKMLAHTSLFEKTFNNMENIYKHNFEMAIKDAGPEIQKKKNLCRKLLNNSLFVQHHAYMIWKEAYHVDDINTKTRQNYYTIHLKNLINVFHSNQNKRVVQIIGVFRRLLEMRNFEEYDYYKNYKNKKCLSFYNNLKKVQSNLKFIFISALKTNQAEYILAEKTKRLHSVFQAMQTAAKENMNSILRTQNQTALLNKTFSKVCNNTMMNVCRLFNIWRENKKALNFRADLKREKKRQMLKLLNSLLIQNLNNKTIQVLHKFDQNCKVANIKKRLLVRLLKAKSDKIPTLFNSWKNLPYQQAKKLKNKATKFENGLLNFMRNYLKQVNDCFKKCHFDGVTKKEQAARRLVRSKLSQVNHLFFRWRKINNENKITEKIITLDKTFSHMSTVFHDNFTIFDDCKMQDQRKIRSATNIFFNNVKRLSGYFIIWRRNTKITKLHHFERLMRNFNPEDYNKRLMRIGFLMIAKRHEMEVLKGYINSLWKWKLSNIQASYYTKFINVFKQSEELIKLSNLINKKLYEHTHHAFRNILSMGHSRTNRKREIVEKYLTRKARNYFLIFKNNTLKSEINIWKSKYTESIKSKILIDVLTSIFLKTKSLAFVTLANYHKFTNKIDSLKAIIEMCQGINLKTAFHQIKYDGQTKLLNQSHNVYQNIKDNNLRQAFTALKNHGKVNKFNDAITAIINRNLKAHAFARINRRKERIIKSKLSIILLQTLLKQHLTQNIKLSIAQFNKNRSKRVGAEKIFKYMSSKYEDASKSLLQGCKNIQNIAKLLERFRRGQMLQKILQKQDELLKKTYLNKMRKKENKWMELAIKKFATRASIRSSPAAITLWRFKTYALNSS